MAVNKIIGAAAAALKSRFGIKIYQDHVEQGLQTPCFYLNLLRTGVTQETGERTRLDIFIDAEYFPHEDGDNAELAGIAAEILRTLEVIVLPDGGSVRGTGRRCEITDGVLHSFVSYTVLLNGKQQQVQMEKFYLKEKTSG